MEGDRQPLRKEKPHGFYEIQCISQKSVRFFLVSGKETDRKTKTERIGRANHVRKSRFDNEDGKK